MAWAYARLDNWPEEVRVLSALRERTLNLVGESSLDHAQVLERMANRASQNREFDQALGWMDEAIEIARALPNAGILMAGLTRERARILELKDTLPGGPLHGP